LPLSEEDELVFVVDVTSFTDKGFVGTTSYEGGKVDLEFDDGTAGVYLTGEMAQRIKVRKGSALSVVVENGKPEVVNTNVASVGKSLRISNTKVYYAVGREGGAILRVRKG